MAPRNVLNEYNVATRELALLRATKPGKDKYGKTIYTIDGTDYTQYGFDNLIKKKQRQVDDLKNLLQPAQVTEAERAALAGEARKQAQQLTDELVKIRESIKEFKSALARAGTSEERAILEGWLRSYTNKEAEFNKAVESLANDSPMLSLPSAPKYVTVEEAKQTKLLGPDVPSVPVAPVAPAAPEVAPAPGVVQPAPLTAGQRGEAGIMQGTGQPTVTPAPEAPVVETPAVTTAPGVSPAPVTTPAPGAPQYTPGQEIGGPDRVLPDGGAVVDGKYVPPGIDYTWLANQAPEDWKQAAKELYGAYYEMIKNDPEISKLLEDAIKNEYSDAQFQAKLEQTNWWRTTTANARQFEILETTDPATARAQLDNRISLVRETAQRLGITLGAESLESIARNAINLGFELTAQVEDLVGSEAIRSAGGMSQLRYGYVGNSIRESARKFGVALSDVTFNEWVNKIAVGSESTETFESYAQQIARNLYPSLNDGFDRGLSFSQMTDPYAQVASRILEIPSTQVDFTDPKWAQAFTMTDASGKPAQMSFGEWADYLRTTPSFGYQYTDDAKSKAYNVVSGLARAFGAG